MTCQFLARGIGKPEQYVTIRSGMEAEPFLTAAPGESRDEVRAILETAKPILGRLAPKFDALHVAIEAVLTANQKAWIASHKPNGPPGHP